MNIDLSPKEYRDLLDLLHIADAVMTGHRQEEDGRTAGHRQLIQKLYGLALTSGFSRLVTFDENLKKYTTTHEFEHGTLAHTLIDEFSDHLFWDQLISRMTARDASQMVGGRDQLEAMSDQQRQQIEFPIRQRYIHEFTTNGVTKLEIVERYSSPGSPGMPVKTSD